MRSVVYLKLLASKDDILCNLNSLQLMIVKVYCKKILLMTQHGSRVHLNIINNRNEWKLFHIIKVLHVLGSSLDPKIYNLAQYREHKHVTMSSSTK